MALILWFPITYFALFSLSTHNAIFKSCLMFLQLNQHANAKHCEQHLSGLLFHKLLCSLINAQVVNRDCSMYCRSRLFWSWVRSWWLTVRCAPLPSPNSCPSSSFSLAEGPFDSSVPKRKGAKLWSISMKRLCPWPLAPVIRVEGTSPPINPEEPRRRSRLVPPPPTDVDPSPSE